MPRKRSTRSSSELQPAGPQWPIWLHFAETLSQHTAALTQQHVALYEDAMRSPVVMKLEAKRIEKCYDAVEARLSDTGGPDLMPGGFSAADIAVGQAVYMARHFAGLDAHPAVTGWYDRITARDGFQRALPPAGADRLYTRDFYPPWETF